MTLYLSVWVYASATEGDWLVGIAALVMLVVWVGALAYNVKRFSPKIKRKRSAEQMATLEDLFDGYEDDVPIGRLYFEQDIPNIDPDWNGEYIRWGLTAYTRKPGREDVFLQDLMLSDFEPCDDDEKPKRKKKESSSISGDDDPVAYFEFDKPTIKEKPETSFGTVYK